MRCCRRLAIISKDPQVKAAWIIYQFGVAHCLFYAVKLGPSYLDVAVAQAIISQGGILSRYFVQRLHMNFGASDEKLIELKAAHGIGSSQSQDPQNIPWASNLPINPDIKTINARLTELIEIGFQLNHQVILDILLVFEKRLEEIGKILIESFAETRHESLHCN
ncbi:17226_t:CDS:2 [Cetraspora pellucida]|uniref:17226_t:CDS:1 n=1 Tax=Cetraspora pellucida TaxID=1433469 RepID=A0A9N9IPW9_9GLOM|nr:17226_t:CDS:2 [Cetraspora pellucida]